MPSHSDNTISILQAGNPRESTQSRDFKLFTLITGTELHENANYWYRLIIGTEQHENSA